MSTERLTKQKNTTQFNAEVNASIKDEFDIKIITMRKIPGHSRNEVIAHLLMYYSQHGLPEFEE